MNEKLHVFDGNLALKGIVTNYLDVEVEPKYHKDGNLIAIVEATKKNVELFINLDEVIKHRIIAESSNLGEGYYVEIAKFKDEKKKEIEIVAKSLSVMLSWRDIEGQQRFTGNIEDVIKAFVNANAINPVNINRKIPNLILGENQGIDITVDETYSDRELGASLWQICEKYDVSYKIIMDHQFKKFVLYTFKGLNRSTEQNVNNRVFFSKKINNVSGSTFTDDISSYRSTGRCLGENGKIVMLNDNLTGFDRREQTVDATSIKQVYKNEADVEVTLTNAEHLALINEYGLNQLADYKRVRNFKSDIIPNSKFQYGVHYFIGDIVSSINTDLNIVQHAKVASVKKQYTKKEFNLSIELGTSIPKRLDKIKKEVKRNA